MSLFGKLAGPSVALSSYLASRDSPLITPYLALGRRTARTLRNDYSTTLVPHEDTENGEVIASREVQKGQIYPPKEIFKGVGNPPFLHSRTACVKVRKVRAAWFHPESSYPYEPRIDGVLVDPALTSLRMGRSNASGHLVAHGRRRAVIRMRRATNSIEKGIFLGGNGSFNYYHWLIEIVSKLAILESAPGLLAGFPLLVNARVFSIPSFRDLLTTLSSGRRLVALSPDESHFVEEAVVIDPYVHAPFHLFRGDAFHADEFVTPKEALDFLRRRILPLLAGGSVTDHPKRIFLARKGRRMYNQEEITGVAAEFGFKAVFPEEHPFIEQVRMFANASSIVGPTGAAWSNMVFAGNTCRALCWMPRELGAFSAFSNICGIVGVDLQYLLYDSGLRALDSVYERNYWLDPSKFRDALALQVD